MVSQSLDTKLCCSSRNTALYYQIFATVIGTLTAMLNGMTVSWTAPMIPYLVSDASHIKMTQSQADWLETWLLIGNVVGLPAAVYLLDKIGRKKSILISSYVLLASWILMTLSNTVEGLFAGRFGIGVALEIAYIGCVIYIAEIADKKIRGFLISIMYLMILAGILLMYSVTPFLPFYATPLIASILSLIIVVVFPFLPESPYHLLLIGKKDEALKSMEKFRSKAAAEIELKEISDGIEEHSANRGRPQDIILVKSNRKAMTIAMVLNVSQQFGGMDVIKMNLHEILDKAGTTYLSTSTVAILFSALMFVATMGASFVIDRFGRKILLAASSGIAGICLLTLSVYFNLKHDGYEQLESINWIPIVTLMVLGFIFDGGLGMVPLVLNGEIFAPEIKSAGMTMAELAFVVMHLLSVQVFLYLRQFGMHIPFYLFTTCLFLTTIFVIYYIPETKGKTLNEIQMLFKEQSKLPNNEIKVDSTSDNVEKQAVALTQL